MIEASFGMNVQADTWVGMVRATATPKATLLAQLDRPSDELLESNC